MCDPTEASQLLQQRIKDQPHMKPASLESLGVGEASNPARWWDGSSFSRQLFPEHLLVVGLRPADPACLLSRGLSLGTGNEAGGNGVPTKILVEESPHIQGPLDNGKGR